MAHAFAEGLTNTTEAIAVAVASRSKENAAAFSNRYSIRKHYSSYADLVADDDVQLVYVATPHSHHMQHSLLCLEAGKGVLCEKPFAVNAKQAQTVLQCAQNRNLFLMEAMWTRFLPAAAKLRELLQDNAIGDVQMVLAGGGFQPKRDSSHYLWRPELAGGVLLDAGVYPVSLASMVLGAPASVKALGSIGEYGVDEQDSVLLGHENGANAMLYISLNTTASPDITILGSRGRIYVHPPMFAPSRIDLHVLGEEPKPFDMPFVGNGYHYQAEAAVSAMRDGKTESDLMPHSETLNIMQTLDEIRRQIGLRYPMEQ